MTTNNNVTVTFSGPSLANVAGQAAAFIEQAKKGFEVQVSAAQPAGKTAKSKTGKGKTVSSVNTEEDDTTFIGDAEAGLETDDDADEGLLADGDEGGEDLLGDENEDDDGLLGEGGEDDAEDQLADEPANGKKTAKAASKAPAKGKTAKAAKLSVDDVNKALIAASRRLGSRKPVETLLTKKFKVKSVSELKPDQFQAAIDAAGAL